MITGRVSFKFAAREETYETGDAITHRPATRPLPAGAEIVEFSPTDCTTELLDRTFEVVGRNMEACAQTA